MFFSSVDSIKRKDCDKSEGAISECLRFNRDSDARETNSCNLLASQQICCMHTNNFILRLLSAVNASCIHLANTMSWILFHIKIVILTMKRVYHRSPNISQDTPRRTNVRLFSHANLRHAFAKAKYRIEQSDSTRWLHVFHSVPADRHIHRESACLTV